MVYDGVQETLTVPPPPPGTKKVQQALAKAGELERFLRHPSDIESIRGVFAGLWSLEPGDPDGMAEVAKAAADPAKYVLKPQREGGGNNYFGDELVQNLKRCKQPKARS